MRIVCLSYGERGESQFAWKEAGATLASVKGGRNSGKAVTYGEAYQRLFPLVVEELV